MTPVYWMYETSGVLKSAVESYLEGGDLSEEHITALRIYFRQWMRGDWVGVDALRRDVDQLTSRAAIHAWLALAMAKGIDPL